MIATITPFPMIHAHMRMVMTIVSELPVTLGRLAITASEMTATAMRTFQTTNAAMKALRNRDGSGLEVGTDSEDIVPYPARFIGSSGIARRKSRKWR